MARSTSVWCSAWTVERRATAAAIFSACSKSNKDVGMAAPLTVTEDNCK